jgi:hypothetical protein
MDWQPGPRAAAARQRLLETFQVAQPARILCERTRLAAAVDAAAARLDDARKSLLEELWVRRHAFGRAAQCHDARTAVDAAVAALDGAKADVARWDDYFLEAVDAAVRGGAPDAFRYFYCECERHPHGCLLHGTSGVYDGTCACGGAAPAAHADVTPAPAPAAPTTRAA